MNQKAHRESGVSADVSWPEKRLKFAVSLRKSRVDGALDERPYMGLENVESWTGRLLLRAPSPDSDEVVSGESLCNSFESGDVLFGKLRPYLAKATVANFAGRCTTEFLVMQPSDLTAKFLFYICVSRGFVTEVDTSTFGSRMPRADWANIGNLRVPIPTLEQQVAITEYLDAEILQVDELIAAKVRWLELLAQKRQALITHVVTRGINPKAPLRDSGTPWLGHVPKHWSVKRLRWFILALEQGWSPQAEDRQPDKGEWAVLKLNAVDGGRFDGSKAKALPPGVEAPMEYEVHSGDFLVTRANTPRLVGDVCFVEYASPRLILSDLIYRLKLDSQHMDGRFLNHFLLTAAGRSQIEADARGSSASMVKIAQDHIKNWLVLAPPLDEQKAIVGHIAKGTAKLDALRAAAEDSIALLKERRDALISAAVTGKLRIPA